MKSKEEIKNILIVDDSGTARTIIKQCLEIAGLRNQTFYEAKNGLEALEVIKNNKIDLLVTDLNMPIMDGSKLLENIKTNPESADIVVLVISSSSNQAKDEELRKIGAGVVLNKPISPAGMIQALRLIVKGI